MYCVELTDPSTSMLLGSVTDTTERVSEVPLVTMMMLCNASYAMK